MTPGPLPRPLAASRPNRRLRRRRGVLRFQRSRVRSP